MTETCRCRVVIAGGGTAGWIVAAALARHLGPLLDITLIESDAIGTIGVGEATIPTIRTFHQMLGIDERDFLRATKASFKLGIAFEDWARVGDRYIHSFGDVGRSTWMGGFQHLWLHARAEGIGGDLGEYSLETQACEAGRFARTSGSRINYAYHLDAGLYAAFLRQLSEQAGVTRCEGRIAQVEQDADTGDIAALRLADGRRLSGDLFIDCTGLRALLIEDTLKAGFEDWGPWLPTDSALAVQTAAVEPAQPYTRSIAHDAGWQWRIPLQHRVGNGIVYAAAHMDDTAARTLLLGSVRGDLLTEPRLIRYRTGRRRAVWVRNCVALGLSSGFVEPLESTSIHLIMIGVTRLIQNFPFAGTSPELAARYNRLAQTELEAVRDFIILHYHLNARGNAPFWTRCREMALPDSLAARLALFAATAQIPQSGDDLFRPDSWLQVMLGQGVQPASYHPMGRLLGAEPLREALRDLNGNITRTVAAMPPHQAFLDQALFDQPDGGRPLA